MIHTASASTHQTAGGNFDDGRPTISDLQGLDPLAQAAKKHWDNVKNLKFKPGAVKTEFYDVLERDGFRYRSLLILEQLQFLEKCVLHWIWQCASWVDGHGLIWCIGQILVAELLGWGDELPCNMYCIDGLCEEEGRCAELGYEARSSIIRLSVMLILFPIARYIQSQPR